MIYYFYKYIHQAFLDYYHRCYKTQLIKTLEDEFLQLLVTLDLQDKNKFTVFQWNKVHEFYTNSHVEHNDIFVAHNIIYQFICSAIVTYFALTGTINGIFYIVPYAIVSAISNTAGLQIFKERNIKKIMNEIHSNYDNINSNYECNQLYDNTQNLIQNMNKTFQQNEHIIHALGTDTKRKLLDICSRYIVHIVNCIVYAKINVLPIQEQFKGQVKIIESGGEIFGAVTQLLSYRERNKQYQLQREEFKDQLQLLQNDHENYKKHILIKTNAILQTKDLSIFSIKYPDIQIHKGEKVLISGANGKGKTTYLNIISGLYKQYSGNVSLNPWLQKIWYLQQQDQINTGTVLQNILMELKDSQQNRKTIQQLCNTFKAEFITQNLEKRMIECQFSGGQKKILCIIRVLLHCKSNKYCLLLLDEPSTYIDEQRRIILYEYIQKQSFSVICITHIKEDSRYFDRTIQFK